jgi:UDP-4-amino-4,6-dideoxy-N-acetyl-beta-L-altrosamine N-acetyltransferase
MSLLEQGSLRPMIEPDLARVLKWRNQERVRECMYTNHVISPEEHRAWYDELDLTTNAYLIFELEGYPVGLSCFNNIDRQHRHVEWGFYLGDSELPRGSGTVMGLLSLDYGYEQLQMRKIYGEVLEFNLSSRKFFDRLGFQQDGLLRQHFTREDKGYDVYLFSQFASEWKEINRPKVCELIRELEVGAV